MPTLTVFAKTFQNVPAEVEPEVGIEMLMVSVLKEPTQDLLFKLVAVGNSQVLDDVLKKSPDKVKHVLYSDVS